MTVAAPVPDITSAPFWAAAAEGRLLLQRCGPAGAAQWYPRIHCVADWNTQPEWFESPGLGRVYSYTFAPAPDANGEAAAIFALVELDEGPVLSAALIDVAPADVHVGMAVAVCFVATDHAAALPCFRPVDAAPDDQGEGR